MKFVQAFLLLAAFQIEVRVRADVAPNEPFWDPPKCSESKTECRVQAGHKTLSLPIHDGHLEVASGSLLERKSSDWKLLKGIARVRQGTVAMINGEVSTDNEAWIIDGGRDRIIVRAVFASAHIAMKDGKEIEVPQGFEVWVGGLQTDGTNAHGMPMQISMPDHLKLWAHVIPGTKKDVTSRAEMLKTEWKDRAVVGSALFKAVIDRQVAEDKKIADEKQEKLEDARMSHEANRRLLFSTAFEK